MQRLHVAWHARLVSVHTWPPCQHRWQTHCAGNGLQCCTDVFICKTFHLELQPSAAPRTRRWYGSHAITIKETTSATDTIKQLAAALRQPPEPITAEEQAAIRAKFSWGTVVPAFYKRIERELRCRPCRPQHLHQDTEDVIESVLTVAEYEAHVESEKHKHGLLGRFGWWPSSRAEHKRHAA
jgi:hypothetical protein